MGEQERPLSTADIAGSGGDSGSGGDMEDRAEMAGTDLTGHATAPEGASDTTAMPMETGRSGGDGGSATLAGTRASGASAATEQPQALLGEEETGTFRARWESIQTGFVDQPRRSVEEADQLVAEVMRRLAETFADARQQLEGQWAGGGEAGTEELRVALQRYRAFFETLLRR